MKKYINFPKTKEEAHKRAIELATDLNKTVGGNWKPCVDFNLNWYYSAQLGTMDISYCRHTNTFICLISDKLGHVGTGAGFWTESKEVGIGLKKHDTPKKAVSEAIKSASKFTKNLVAIIESNNNLMKKPTRKLKTVKKLK